MIAIARSIILLLVLLLPWQGARADTPFTSFAYPATGGTANRKDADRWNDHGVNILEFGADPTGVSDSAAAIQAAIDYSYNSAGGRAVYCPQGKYKTTLPIFLDAPGNLRGSPTAWSGATTYHIGDVASQSGIPWVAAAQLTGLTLGAAGQGYAINDVLWLADNGTHLKMAKVTVNTVSAGAILTFTVSTAGQYTLAPTTFTAQGGSGNGATFTTPIWGTNVNHNPSSDLGTAIPVWWTPTVVSPSQSNNSASLIGAPALAPGSSLTTSCIIRPTFNNAPAIIINPGDGNLIRSIHITGPNDNNRCGKPAQGIGWAIPGFSGGASKTKFEDTSADHFYFGYNIGGFGTGQLADNSSILKSLFNDACVGVVFGETQAFVNDIIDTSAGTQGANTAVQSDLNGGVNIYGGNYSTVGFNSAFTISGVAAAVVANSAILKAAVSAPDGHLTSTFCEQNLQCVYNAFTVKTANFGVVPFVIDSFDGTNIVLHALPAWMAVYQNTMGQDADFAADLAAVTTLYAAENVTTFLGSGMNITGVHVEDPNTSNTLIDTTARFGSRPDYLNGVYINADPSNGGYVCCGQSPSNAVLAAFYAAQTFAFIRHRNADLIINGLHGGAGNSADRVMIEDAAGNFVWRDQIIAPTMYLNHRMAATKTFTNNYAAIASPGEGGGIFDNASGFTAARCTNGASCSPAAVTQSTSADTWRSAGWGAGPTWGFRPAPWSQPCLTPAQVTTLVGVLPAITSTAVSYPILWGGTVYKACDWNSISHNSIISAHKLYSYGQNFTTTNIPGLSWSLKHLSPALYVTDTAAGTDATNLLFPGLGITLTCNAQTKAAVITQVFPDLGYVMILDADQDGTPYLLDFGQDCTGSTIGQPAYSITQF